MGITEREKNGNHGRMGTFFLITTLEIRIFLVGGFKYFYFHKISNWTNIFQGG